MKLTTLTNVLRNKVARGAAIAALAGAAMAATPAAQAQRVYFGVHFGPRYVAPAPVYVAPAPVYAEPGPAVYFRGPAFGYGYYDRFHAWHRDDRWHRGYDGRWHR